MITMIVYFLIHCFGGTLEGFVADVTLETPIMEASVGK